MEVFCFHDSPPLTFPLLGAASIISVGSASVLWATALTQLGLQLDQPQEASIFSLIIGLARHLVVIRGGYLKLAYLVWLLCSLNSGGEQISAHYPGRKKKKSTSWGPASRNSCAARHWQKIQPFSWGRWGGNGSKLRSLSLLMVQLSSAVDPTVIYRWRAKNTIWIIKRFSL